MTEKGQSTVFAFTIITILFFLWGGITSMTDIVKPFYEKLYGLSKFEGSLIFLSFFGAYGIGSLLYYIYSQAKGDLINKLGYKRGILYGLIISGIGCVSLYPITYADNYFIAIISFFIIGLGFTLLQISCNPYVAILGPQKSAGARLNLSQGFNSLGTTVGPLITGFLVIRYVSKTAAIQDIYLIAGIIFFVFAIFLSFVQLPEYKSPENAKLDGSALQFSHLRAGMIAIFVYVGAEVMIGGELSSYLQLPEIGNLSESEAGSYLGIYWGGAMIGRLGISVISSPKFDLVKKLVYGFITIALTYLLIVLLVGIKTKVLDPNLAFTMDNIGAAFTATFAEIYPILGFVALQFTVMLIFRESSRKLLAFFAFLIICALLIAFIFEGQVALWSILSIGLFNSIMWSNVFTLSIAGLKEYTSQGSSLLIIMIVGGALLPLVMGLISDLTNAKVGLLFPIISYLYILYFGVYGSKTKQNL